MSYSYRYFPFRLTLSSEPWDEYVEFLQWHIFDDQWKPQDKTAAMIRCADSKTFKLMKMLCHPVDPYKKPFETLAYLVGDYLDKMKLESILRARKTFYDSVQQRGQNVSSYASTLEKLIEKCYFNSIIKSDTLKKRFIFGLRSGSHRIRLIPKMSDMTYTEAVKMASEMEEREIKMRLILMPRGPLRLREPEPHPIFGPKVIVQRIEENGQLTVIDANGVPLKDQKRPFMIPYTPGESLEKTTLAHFMEETAPKRFCARPEEANTS